MIVLLFLGPSLGLSVAVRLKTGETLEGVIIQEDADQVMLAFEYGSRTIGRLNIESITRNPTAPGESTPPKKGASRVPSWLNVVKRLAAQAWATKIQQIPASVVDKGVLRHVPYMSYRCGQNQGYELNVYGDPDEPTCVEIGVYGELRRDVAAKKKCVEFLAGLLREKEDKAILRSARLQSDRIERNGLTVEITPETAEDAYGGWWVSVYEVAALDEARATESELNDIIFASPLQATPDSAPIPSSVGTEAVPQSTSTVAETSSPDWSPSDLQYARNSRSTPSGSSSSSTGTRVFVRGYHRKDGTYVRAHTRSRPRR
jgi:hypothetical protein